VAARLHRATATKRQCGSRELERWVDDHVRALTARARRRDPRLERVREELHGALRGRTFATCWIHGDFWPGNLLFARGGRELTGVVDWEAAAPDELALHDLLHLLLYVRRLQTGRELGQLIIELLRGRRWTEQERRVIDACGPDDLLLGEREAVLLYWLRHAAFHVRQQGPSPGYRHRLWEIRNVQRVLAAL
jgi:thiamine kinase-like enzyme